MWVNEERGREREEDREGGSENKTLNLGWGGERNVFVSEEASIKVIGERTRERERGRERGKERKREGDRKSQREREREGEKEALNYSCLKL